MFPATVMFSLRLRSAPEWMVRLPNTPALAASGLRTQRVDVPAASPATRLVTPTKRLEADPVPVRVRVLFPVPRSTMPTRVAPVPRATALSALPVIQPPNPSGAPARMA